MLDLSNRTDFVTVAVVFEGSLAGLALALGWWLEVDPLAQFAWNWNGWLGGLAATVPMYVLFMIAYRFPFGPFRKIKQFLKDALGTSLVTCRWHDLLLVALVAGAGEELLFRGVLHPKMGLLGSNFLFGLVHFITPTYAIAAGLIGTFMGWLLDFSGNLLAPILAHGLYDFAALIVIARDLRRQAAPPPG
ncbi:MAG: CPBP family intramembrane metalloprotease [Planctomycetia bacterium]|nr:CPBP family intramembrane metalloprotease [Planctomycetia bacterium]